MCHHFSYESRVLNVATRVHLSSIFSSLANQGQMYIHENAEGDSGIRRMKSAVWVDLASALLWLFSAVGAAIYWWRHRDHRSQFTGRAHV